VADAADKSDPGGHNCQRRELPLAGLARLAERQLSLVSQTQLYALGLSAKQIRRMVALGHLHAVCQNVYAVGHPGIVPRAHLLAAQLSLGPRSFLSHRTAAALHGLRAVNTHDIEVTVPGKGARRRPGVTIHRTEAAIPPDEIRTAGLFRVSSVLRMLVELAARESAAELERLITTAIQRRLLTPDTRDGRAAIETVLACHRRFPGRGRLVVVLATYRRVESHASQLELAFDRLLHGHPEIPEPQRNVRIDRWEIDRCWPAQRLVVELDGRPYHIAAGAMERDRIKDASLQRLGYVVLRFSELRVEHDAPGILRDLRHFLGVSAGIQADGARG